MSLESKKDQLNAEINRLMSSLVKRKYPDKVSHECHWINIINRQLSCNLCGQLMCHNTEKGYDRNKINEHAKVHLKNLLAFS